MPRATHIFLLLIGVAIVGCGDDAQSPNTKSVSNSSNVTADGAEVTASAQTGNESGGADAASDSGTRKTGDVVTNSIGMKLAVIPPGEFAMGSPDTEEKRSGDESLHQITVTKAVFMGAHEVTQAEFEKVMESNPSGIKDSDKLPVHNVSWEEATAFCRRLSDLPEEKAAGRVYRLPTEAEWEYACRAGSTTASAFGNSMTSNLANFDGNYPYASETKGSFVGRPQAVGSYQANAWGLYDMHGNVWEWCNDWYQADYYLTSPASDPQGPETGISHVIRGGSWYNFGYVIRSAYRSEFTPPLEANIYGFRVVASFGKGDKFEASALDKPNPTPPSPTPIPMTASTPPAKATTPPAPATTPPTATSMSKPDDRMMASAGSTPMMTDSMSDSVTESPSSTSRAAFTAASNSTTGSETDTAEPTEKKRGSTATASGTSLAQWVLLVLAFLCLLSLMDSTRLSRARHLDLVPIALLSIGLVLPQTASQLWILWILAAALSAKVLLDVRKNSFPKAVVPKSNEALVGIALACAFGVSTLLNLIVGNDASLVRSMMSVVESAAVIVGLVLIGQRWQSRKLGLTVAIVWLVVPIREHSLVTALTLWAFVFLNRAPLAGLLLGLAIGITPWVFVLVPLWSSYYLGKARTRFFTTATTTAVAGCLLVNVLPNLLAFSSTRTDGAVSSGMMFYTLAVGLAAAGSAASWYWPRHKNESLITALSTSLLLLVFLVTRAPTAIAIALPWIVLVSIGGTATRKVMTTEGWLIPQIKKLIARPAKSNTSATT